jgi:penicillin-binding protein 1A
MNRTTEQQGFVHSLGCRSQRSSTRWRKFACWATVAAAIGMLAGFALVYSMDLPQIHDLDHYRAASSTVLYDDIGRPYASFALQRRIIAQYEDFPKVLYDAVLSIEDRNFEKHPGFDFWRMVSAALQDLQRGETVQGASTLTMQLARNLFLSHERTYRRKIREIIVSVQIERHFTKSQIFTLYANQIYLGHGVYGFETGAQYYFGKPAKDLTLDEAATLAALPKAPNVYSPIKDPDRALRRRNLVIDSMLNAGKINPAEATAAKKKPIQLHVQDYSNALAPHFVEEIRQYLEKRYGTEQVHEGGLRVYTTLDIDLQKAANRALLDGLATYERRHGWHTRLQNVANVKNIADQSKPFGPSIQVVPDSYCYAEVMSVSSSSAMIRLGAYAGVIQAPDIAWTNHTLPQLLAVGDVVYVRVLALKPNFEAQIRLEQDSNLQGALLAIDNATGEIKAMIGGRDFNRSKFNRATQAFRQVGSSFKPYVYTAAIDQGAAPDDIVIDAPETFQTPSGAYTPHNYDGKFQGAITLVHALAESRNLPTLRLARTLGINTVIAYAHRFGIRERIPNYLPIALGAADLTLLEQTSAFTTFPNDGVRPIPHSIVKVTDYDGRVLEWNHPIVQDVINSNTARTMTWMLRQVVLRGTAQSALRLKRPVAGKTGTTNDFTDAWFVGFSPSLTCGVWVGFDDRATLGEKETGAKAALPIWIDFMDTALSREKPTITFLPPVAAVDLALARGTADVTSDPERRSYRETIRAPKPLLVQPASNTRRDIPGPDPQD